jgi:hypothetical protein
MKPTNRLQELLKVSYTAVPTQLIFLKENPTYRTGHTCIGKSSFFVLLLKTQFYLSFFQRLSTLGVENMVFYTTKRVPIKGCKIT